MSLVVLAEVTFPTNPQTIAECDGPVAEISAMIAREIDLYGRAVKERDSLPYEPSWDNPNWTRAQLVVRAHADERERLIEQRTRLEKSCRAAAKLNEQRAAEGKDETHSILARFGELKEGYEDAKHAFEMAKDLYMKRPAELAEDAGNRATARLADGTIDSAYRRRNDAYSAELEKAMNAAKRKTVDLVRRSDVIAAIQGASFNELKSQVHQLYGDMNWLESQVGSSSMLPDEPTVALARPRANGAAVMFQQALDQAQQQERERQRLISDARERARVAAIAEDQARLQREKERVAAPAEVPRPASAASPVVSTPAKRSDCLPDEGTLQRYADIVNANRRSLGVSFKSNYTVSELRQGQEGVKDKYSGNSLEALQQILGYKKQQVGKRWSNSASVAQENSMDEQFEIRILQCLVDQKISAAKGSAGPMTNR